MKYLKTYLEAWAEYCEDVRVGENSLLSLHTVTEDGKSYSSVDTRLFVCIRDAIAQLNSLEKQVEELKHIKRIVDIVSTMES